MVQHEEVRPKDPQLKSRATKRVGPNNKPSKDQMLESRDSWKRGDQVAGMSGKGSQFEILVEDNMDENELVKVHVLKETFESLPRPIISPSVLSKNEE